jgi:hypothetical protein
MASNTTSVRTLPARPSLESLRKQAKTLGRKVAADVNTDWATHEPASILHECALHGDFEGARFLIAHGIRPHHPRSPLGRDRRRLGVARGERPGDVQNAD